VTGEPGSRQLGGAWYGPPQTMFDHHAKQRAAGTALDPFHLA
jgi:hypothetical protein